MRFLDSKSTAWDFFTERLYRLPTNTTFDEKDQYPLISRVTAVVFGLFEMQIEVCDANVTYVEEHLDEVGGGFLPKSFWCPWSSELEAEIPVRP